MRIGIGYCNVASGLESGRIVAKAALENGDISAPQLVVAFCHGNVNHTDFYQGMRSVVGEAVPIIGGSAIGVIALDAFSYTGYPTGAAIFEAKRDDVRFGVASASGLKEDERKTGIELGRKVACTSSTKALIVLYDSIKMPANPTSPPIMNASSMLIEGLETGLTDIVPIFGGGILGDYTFQNTLQFCGNRIADQSAVALTIDGNLQVHYRIMHGCTPFDGIYHKITRSEGARIYELNYRPIVDVLDELYGDSEWQKQIPVQRLTIGVNHGERFGEHAEGNFVNRLISGVLPNREGIVLFEPDLDAGTEILFMLRDSQEMIWSAKKNTLDIFREVENAGREPVFGFYIDCAGRAASFSETVHEEASEVVEVFKEKETPLLGFFSGVEIAPFIGRSRGLDWTGLLLLFSK